MPLYVFSCMGCGQQTRKLIKGSPATAKLVVPYCSCGRIWERNPLPEMPMPPVPSSCGTIDTPYGPLEPTLVKAVEYVERNAIEAIRGCSTHKPPNCDCWAFARQYAQAVWERDGERSPYGARCSSMWDSLEREERKPTLKGISVTEDDNGQQNY